MAAELTIPSKLALRARPIERLLDALGIGFGSGFDGGGWVAMGCIGVPSLRVVGEVEVRTLPPKKLDDELETELLEVVLSAWRRLAMADEEGFEDSEREKAGAAACESDIVPPREVDAVE